MHNPEMTINHTKQHLEFQQYEKPEVAELQSETRRLKEENERIKSELQREHEMYVSNLADFDHYRRRVERERVQSAQAGKRELILSLLDVVDDFEWMIKQPQENTHSLVTACQAIYTRLMGVLEAQGVSAFESLGKPFNPLFHQVIETVKYEGAETGTVVAETRRGWRWGDDLLRPAQVRIAQ